MVDGPFRDTKGRSYPHPQILDPSMKDWYQYQPWNLTHRVQLRESRYVTYHPTELLPNSCGPMADGSFRDPKGQSYPHPKYWTHRWRIDINTSHGISPIESSLENQGTWHIIRRHYYQIAAANCWMVYFDTPRVGPIHTPNIGPIDERLISNWPWNLTHRVQLRESRHLIHHTTALLPNSCGLMADGLFRDPKGRSWPHPKYWTHRWRIDINTSHEISPIVSS